jgi:N-acetylglucosamine-6-phosphate deacetylase
MILVSDAMATVGGPDAFMLYGQEIHLDDGRLVNAEGSLAGAHLTMLDALRNLVSYGVDLQAALRMCRQNPAQLLGIWDMLGLIGMDAADLLVLDDDLSLKQVGVALTPKAQSKLESRDFFESENRSTFGPN